MKTEQTATQIAAGRGYPTVLYLTTWGGYEVYSRAYHDDDEVPDIGMPEFVLVNGEEARLATPNEVLAIAATLPEEEE